MRPSSMPQGAQTIKAGASSGMKDTWRLGTQGSVFSSADTPGRTADMRTGLERLRRVWHANQTGKPAIHYVGWEQA